MSLDRSKIGPNDAVIYARFSPRPMTKKGKAPGERVTVEIDTSERIDMQQHLNRTYCKWANLNPRFSISEPYTSAYELDLAARPRGAELIELFKSGCHHIVASKLDRIFRNTRDGLYWLEEGFPKYNVTLHIADQRGVTLRTNTADGYLTAVMLLTMATIEPMRTRERTKKGMRAHQRNGIKMGGVAPYGTQFDPARPGRIIEHPEEQSILEAIRSLSAAGYTAQQIKKELDDRGLKTRSGTAWHHGTIRRIIDRELAPVS
jgi:site-specific DNA recombinase